jgi:predicted dehydrogenase
LADLTDLARMERSLTDDDEAACRCEPATIPETDRGLDDGRGGVAADCPRVRARAERITVGLVGMGQQMKMHNSVFLRFSETQVLAMCDVESICLERELTLAKKRYEAAEGRGEGYRADVQGYKDFRELVARDDIDAVVIATPDHWHALIAVAAMKAGKDVYCEKPMSLTIEEGRAMADAARRYGRVFQTGSQQRSSQEFRFACEMVRNGRIGEIKTVNVNVGGPSTDSWALPGEPIPEKLDWDMWLGPAPYRSYNTVLAPGPNFNSFPNWRGYRDYSGGGMTDWGAHHFDIAQWGLGMDDTGPVEIAPPNGKDVERLTYKYANGIVMYHGGGYDRAGTEFIGTEGIVRVNRGYLETVPETIMKTPTQVNELHLYESSSHHQDWLNCIRSRRRPICDVEIGQRSVSVCHLGNIAYWLKRPLKWDPAKERFLDDEEANRMLRRAMRSPWRLS